MRRRNFQREGFAGSEPSMAPPPEVVPETPVIKEVKPEIELFSRPPHPVKGTCRWCEKYIGRGKGPHERFCDAQIKDDGLRVKNEHAWKSQDEDC